MIEAIKSESITSFIKRVRKTEPPPRKPAIVIPVKTKPKRVYQKPEQPDLPFDEWTMPPQGEGYIKCTKHDFL